MTLLLSFVTSLLFASVNVLTAQEPDRIFFHGEDLPLLCNPLEPYFEQNPEARPRPHGMSTARGRQYIAIFELSDSLLVVHDIFQSSFDSVDTQISVVNAVFPSGVSRNAVWYYGLLIMGHGRVKHYVHSGYGSTWESYTLALISQGKLIRTRELTSEQYVAFRQRQFEEFRKSREYRDIRAVRLPMSNMSEEQFDRFYYNADKRYTREYVLDF